MNKNMNDNNQNPPNETQHHGTNTPEVVNLDKAKIDKVLDSFLREQEIAKEREKQREIKIQKKKRAKKMAKIISFVGLALFVLVLILINPETKKRYERYVESQAPKQEYAFNYNYSPGMKILPLSDSLVMYDSGNLRLLKKDGSEIFDIPFALANWDMATSDHAIYLLNRIEKVLYFIDEEGNFINQVPLGNIPSKLYAGKAGNLVVHYKSEAGVEGIVMFDSYGNQLEDLTYPKTTITWIDINEQNQTTVHGMYRIEPKLTNYMYRYNPKGKLIFSKNFEDVIFFRQFENDSTIAMVDVNRIQFYSKAGNEPTVSVDSLIPAKLIAYDKIDQNIYFLDKRNKLRVINMQGEVIEEKHFQIEYEKMVIYHGNLLMFGQDFIRTNSKEIQYPKKIDSVFELGDYLVCVMKGEVRMTNKME
ncbi:MAG: DUF5711 family protein [Peptostreptococcaceae bacterium]|nr:DUF5711 family protein [Peptostreptococcaceae bacterium]